MLEDGKYYWIKWTDSHDWEIVVYVDKWKEFKFFDRCHGDPKKAYKIEYNPITKPSND